VARGALLVGLAALFLCAAVQTFDFDPKPRPRGSEIAAAARTFHFDQPRPRGSEIAADQDDAHARGPTPPLGGAAERGAHARGPTPPLGGAAERGAHTRGPTPPLGGAARARGCPRETLVRFSVFDAWLRELPLGWLLADVAARRLVGSCSPV